MEQDLGSDIAGVRLLVNAVCTKDDPTELVELVREHPDLLQPFRRQLIASGIFWPPDLYYGMDEETAAYLVEEIDNGSPDAERLFSVLVAAPTQAAAAAVACWRDTRPQWTSQLHWPVERYPHIGGWELDTTTQVRHLTSPTAHALTPTDSSESVSGGALSVACHWCGMALWRILDVDLADCALVDQQLDTPAGRVVAATCIRCGCYTTLFTEYDADGQIRWAAENQRPDFLGHEGDTWDLPAETRLHVDSRRSTPYGGDAWAAGGSTLGGLPDWVQDPDYPACPRCSRTMRYLGMITGDDLWGESAEGCHYAFADPDCRTSAVVYQQS